MIIFTVIFVSPSIIKLPLPRKTSFVGLLWWSSGSIQGVQFQSLVGGKSLLSYFLEFPGVFDSASGLPWWLRGYSVYLQCRRPGFHPWVGEIPGRRKWQPTPYSCLENPMDRGAWWATVHGVAKSQTQLSDFTFTFDNASEQIILIPIG